MTSSDQKAFLETETGTRIPCLFNPADISLELSAGWSGTAAPGRAAPTLQFTGGSSGRFTLELMFDTSVVTDAGASQPTPVTDHVNALIALTQIDDQLPGHDDAAGNGRPPWVKLHWGSFHTFRCVVTALNVKFVAFGPTGDPLRATASVTLTQYEPDDQWPAQNPTSGTPRPARSHRLQPGESLDRVAAVHYGDATRWRAIARANGIRDPFAIAPGTILDVPVLDER